MNVGVDIDGVLFPWEDAVKEAALERWGVTLGELTAWDTYEHELGPERWGWLWTPEGTDAVMGRTELVYPGAAEAIRGVLELGNRVHFVTHRDPCLAGAHTAAFLARHFGGLRWEGLHVTRSSVAKRTLARWDVFVDDKPDTVFDFLANTNATVFSPLRTWNADEYAGLYEAHLYAYRDPAVILEWFEARA